MPAAASPTLETSALIELPGAATADPSTLLAHRQPLHLVVLHIQPAPALLTPTTMLDAARMSTSPSASSTASIGIAQQQHSWGHQDQVGQSPPGLGSGFTHGYSSSSSNASGALPGTAIRSPPNAGPAYVLTATSGQQTYQQGPGRAVPSAQHSTDMLRMSSKTGVVGSCHVDWRLALTSRGEPSCHTVQLTAGTQTESVGSISLDLEVGPTFLASSYLLVP